MWGWLKALWSSKGDGGCITVDSRGPVTLTPLESKLSSRSCKGTNQNGTGVQQVVKQLVQGATDDSTPQQNQRQQQQQGNAALQPDSSRAPGQLGGSSAVELPPSAGRYMYSGGKPVGIANTVQRYHESRPLVPHLTPFEARLEAKIAEEEMAAAALQAGGAAVLQAGGAAGSTKKQLFDAQ